MGSGVWEEGQGWGGSALRVQEPVQEGTTQMASRVQFPSLSPSVLLRKTHREAHGARGPRSSVLISRISHYWKKEQAPPTHPASLRAASLVYERPSGSRNKEPIQNVGGQDQKALRPGW